MAAALQEVAPRSMATRFAQLSSYADPKRMLYCLPMASCFCPPIGPRTMAPDP